MEREFIVEVAIVGSDKCVAYECLNTLSEARKRAKFLSSRYNDYNRYDVFIHYESEDGYPMEEEYCNGKCINIMEC